MRAGTAERRFVRFSATDRVQGFTLRPSNRRRIYLISFPSLLFTEFISDFIGWRLRNWTFLFRNSLSRTGLHYTRAVGTILADQMSTFGPDDSERLAVMPSVLELPPPDTKRWVARRKASVVAAVCGGVLSAQEACRRYRLSLEELLAWQRAVERHGIPGLRVTRLQLYRDASALKAAE